MKKIRAAFFIILFIPSMGWADPTMDDSSANNPTTLSVSYLGRTFFGLGIEVEHGLSDTVRAGVGVSAGFAGQQGMAAAPLYLGIYPGGVGRHAFYVDLGLKPTLLTGCCGGAARGGTDPEFSVVPFGGVGYSFLGDHIMFKAGVETAMFGFILPFIRVGYVF